MTTFFSNLDSSPVVLVFVLGVLTIPLTYKLLCYTGLINDWVIDRGIQTEVLPGKQNIYRGNRTFT